MCPRMGENSGISCHVVSRTPMPISADLYTRQQFKGPLKLRYVTFPGSLFESKGPHSSMVSYRKRSKLAQINIFSAAKNMRVKTTKIAHII